jgi:hypothetical protein
VCLGGISSAGSTAAKAAVAAAWRNGFRAGTLKLMGAAVKATTKKIVLEAAKNPQAAIRQVLIKRGGQAAVAAAGVAQSVISSLPQQCYDMVEYMMSDESPIFDPTDWVEWASLEVAPVCCSVLAEGLEEEGAAISFTRPCMLVGSCGGFGGQAAGSR